MWLGSRPRLFRDDGLAAGRGEQWKPWEVMGYTSKRSGSAGCLLFLRPRQRWLTMKQLPELRAHGLPGQWGSRTVGFIGKKVKAEDWQLRTGLGGGLRALRCE